MFDDADNPPRPLGNKKIDDLLIGGQTGDIEELTLGDIAEYLETRLEIGNAKSDVRIEFF